MAKTVSAIALLSFLLANGSLAMDITLQTRAAQAYRRWFPLNPAVHYQDAEHNYMLINHLREHVNSMGIVEVQPSETHRHFVVPLQLRGRHRLYEMPYSNKKNYFAGFRLPINSFTRTTVNDGEWVISPTLEGTGILTHTATFDGIGAINGINVREATRKFGTDIPIFAISDYGVTLHIP